jgi:hypothetical protein
MQYGINVAIQASGAIPQPVYEATAGALRPHDEAMCIWIDESDSTRLLVSTDVQADSAEAALTPARALAEETLALFGMEARLEEISADSEEDLDEYAICRPDGH